MGYRSFRGYGLFFHSCVPINGAIADSDHGRRPDVVIDFGAARLSNVEAVAGGFSRGPEGLLFTSGAGKFLITADRVVVEPADGADTDALAIRLVATVLPALVYTRGEDIVLHASVIAPPGSEMCVAVCGPSGAGKSTIAQGALARGARLVADDSVRLSKTDTGILASGLPMQISRPGPDGTRLGNDIDGSKTQECAELQRIVILGSTEVEQHRQRTSRIAPERAFRELAAQLHRPNAAIAMQRQAAILPVLAEASRLDMWQLDRRLDERDLRDEEWALLLAPRGPASA